MMFCPKCGKSDQIPATYCRQCGAFQPDLSKPYNFPHLSQQFTRVNTIVSVAASFVSFVLAIILYTVILGIGGGILVHLLAWATIALGLWSAFAGWKSYQLGKDFRKGAKEQSETFDRMMPPVTDKLLDKPNFEHFVPPSVTDSTTQQLTKEDKRSSET